MSASFCHDLTIHSPIKPSQVIDYSETMNIAVPVMGPVSAIMLIHIINVHFGELTHVLTQIQYLQYFCRLRYGNFYCSNEMYSFSLSSGNFRESNMTLTLIMALTSATSTPYLYFRLICWQS